MTSQARPRLPHLKDAIAALSLATLLFIWSCFGNLYDVRFGYFSKLPVTTTILLAQLCNLLGFAALFWLGAQVLRRHRRRGLDWAACLVILVVLLAPVEFLRSVHLGIRDRQVLDFARSWPGLGLAAAMLGGVLWRPRWVMKAVAALLLISSPMAFYLLARTLLLTLQLQFQAPSAGRVGPPPPPLYTHRQPVRVVWIIFDELDERLTFSQRPPGLALPELDRFRGEALVATNAYAPAGCTRVSMPSLIAGQVFQTAEPSSAQDLRLTVSPTNPPVGFSQLTNVFDEVRALGGNTAVVGWYHPYARLLQRSLNFVAWDDCAADQTRHCATFWGALKDQVGTGLHSVQSRFWHRQRVADAIGQSLGVVTNAAYALTLLHLPFPHYPAIYDPVQQRLTISMQPFPQGYFDNLQLTDRVLGQLRAVMEQSGQWDKTWVLVSADHFWRSAFTYDGRTDQRVPFLLKAPGHAPGLGCGTVLNTVATKDLILAILRGQVPDLPAAEIWLTAHPGTLPDYSTTLN